VLGAKKGCYSPNLFFPSDLKAHTVLPVIESLATAFFIFALVHTFLAPKLGALRHRFRTNSGAENLLHLLSEVEIVFGLWAALLLLVWAAAESLGYKQKLSPITYIESVNFSEAVFVFVIMTLSSARPILGFCRKLIVFISGWLTFSEGRNRAVVVLIVGPLLGSFITEPAAMTVSCYLLWPIITASVVSSKTRYLLLGLLFVNISIGGTLTNFAAPPVLVVARHWDWSSLYMLEHIGWRSIISVFVSTLILTFYSRHELDQITLGPIEQESDPAWVVLVDLLFIFLAVLASHHTVLLFGLFLFYFGWATVTNEFREETKLKASLLVGFFLAGLVTLGGLQEWWIRPLLGQLEGSMLFWGATALTAITDNALLTYLGTLVPEFSSEQKLDLVMGAVCGGGLTVIANAPNPIGYSLLKEAFGEGGIEASKLFLSALIPTLVAAVLFLV